MKKFTSLLLTVLMLATVLSVFALPAFAKDAPTVINADTLLTVRGNSIITQPGEYEVRYINVSKGSTLYIGKGVKIKVTNEFANFGKVIVHGVLDIQNNNCTINNSGSVLVFDCCGEFLYSNDPDSKSYFCEEYAKRVETLHSVCPIDIADFLEIEYEANVSDSTASTLSEGDIWIIIAVAVAVVFGLGGFILGGKKKKHAQE